MMVPTMVAVVMAVVAGGLMGPVMAVACLLPRSDGAVSTPKAWPASRTPVRIVMDEGFGTATL